MRNLFLSFAFILTFSVASYGTTVSSISIQSRFYDNTDKNRVAMGLFDAIKSKEKSETKGKQTKTTRTAGQVSCTKVTECDLPVLEYFDCTFEARSWAPGGTLHFNIETDNDELKVTARKDFWDQIDTAKLRGTKCDTVRISPPIEGAPGFDQTTCRFDLR